YVAVHLVRHHSPGIGVHLETEIALEVRAAFVADSSVANALDHRLIGQWRAVADPHLSGDETRTIVRRAGKVIRKIEIGIRCWRSAGAARSISGTAARAPLSGERTGKEKQSQR